MTVSSAKCPASSGHRKIAVASRITIRAQPIAAAVVARAERRAVNRIAEPEQRDHRRDPGGEQAVVQGGGDPFDRGVEDVQEGRMRTRPR